MHMPLPLRICIGGFLMKVWIHWWLQKKEFLSNFTWLREDPFGTKQFCPRLDSWKWTINFDLSLLMIHLTCYWTLNRMLYLCELYYEYSFCICWLILKSDYCANAFSAWLKCFEVWRNNPLSYEYAWFHHMTF